VIQVLSLVGALCVLGAYVAIQTHRVDAENVRYQALNLVGSIALAVAAVVMFNLGVIVLNVAWAFVSLRTLIGHRRSRPRGGGMPSSDG
jgi:NADH:ubiquinone oxidoreductase subunit 6 (subunit J)